MVRARPAGRRWTPSSRAGWRRVMDQPEIDLRVALNGAGAASTVYFSDLTHDYVHPQRGVLDMTVRHQKTVKTLIEAHAVHPPLLGHDHGAQVRRRRDDLAAASQEQFAEDVVLLRLVGMKPVVVHGGGPEITRHMGRLGMEPAFVDGQRVTDEATMEIAKMVLVGKVNKDIVGLINRHGGTAVGISGRGRPAAPASQPKEHRDLAGNVVDLGFVGEVESVNTAVLDLLAEARSSRWWPAWAPTPTARRTTSTPTPWPARWPRRRGRREDHLPDRRGAASTRSDGAEQAPV